MERPRTRDARLEHFPFRLNRNGAPASCFDAFSLREPESTSLENALVRTKNAIILVIQGPCIQSELTCFVAEWKPRRSLTWIRTIGRSIQLEGLCLAFNRGSVTDVTHIVTPLHTAADGGSAPRRTFERSPRDKHVSIGMLVSA